MGSKSRQILVSETTFNRLTAGLLSFNDTLDAVVSRAMDAMDRAGAPASAPVSAAPTGTGIMPYEVNVDGFRAVPIDANRSMISFSTPTRVLAWNDQPSNTPVTDVHLASLRLMLSKAPMTWNGIALALVGYYLRNCAQDGHIHAVGSRETLFGAQIACIAACSEVPKNWSIVDASDTRDAVPTVIMQGLSAPQSLQTIRRVMAKIYSDHGIMLRLNLEWNNTPKAAFPGERGYIMFNDQPLTTKG